MEQKPYKTITIKDAAQRLGVHPQTIRGWEERGLIHLVRLPGSGYRRVLESEVDRMSTIMGGAPVTRRGVRVVPPPRGDASSLSVARQLAEAIRAELALAPIHESLDETMSRLRGRSWSS
ncbi:MAG: MerR family DNA-binding transcriptional regulator [Chloroflexi bacterium]|nr:MerR family DNA-binding transcriptional regulator [Chloroflexota bacterium]